MQTLSAPASRRSALCLLSTVTLAAMLPGCIAVENEYSTRDPSIKPARVWYAQDNTLTGTLVVADAPAMSSLNRSSWLPIQYTIADGSVAHAPTYSPEYNVLSMDDYRGKDAPNINSSLSADEQSNMEQAQVAFVAPALAAFDLVAILPRMIIEDQPWDVVRSPDTVPVTRRTEQSSLPESQ